MTLPVSTARANWLALRNDLRKLSKVESRHQKLLRAAFETVAIATGDDTGKQVRIESEHWGLLDSALESCWERLSKRSKQAADAIKAVVLGSHVPEGKESREVPAAELAAARLMDEEAVA